jgi:predicted NAD-dependent protein-ADP-ribosyltransferase YbiA (DUF1768 family)
MKEIIRAKYSQCQAFRQELAATDRKVLIEDTCNSFWGRGRDGAGRNMLGVVLMEVRYAM